MFIHKSDWPASLSSYSSLSSLQSPPKCSSLSSPSSSRTSWPSTWPGLEQPGHRHHTILFDICHLSESIYFLQTCMLWVKSREAALFHIASTKLALLILYYSTLWHGDITFCQVDHDLPLEHTSVETLDILTLSTFLFILDSHRELIRMIQYPSLGLLTLNSHHQVYLYRLFCIIAPPDIGWHIHVYRLLLYTKDSTVHLGVMMLTCSFTPCERWFLSILPPTDLLLFAMDGRYYLNLLNMDETHPGVKECSLWPEKTKRLDKSTPITQLQECFLPISLSAVTWPISCWKPCWSCHILGTWKSLSWVLGC